MKAAVFALAAIAASPAVLAESPLQSRETAIPHAARDIQDWKVDGNRALYIRSLNGKWYHARTANVCSRLATANALGFETRGGGELDKFGAIIAQGWRCPLISVTLSDGPPKKAKRAG